MSNCKSTTVDIVDAYSHIDTILSFYKTMRTNVDKEFHGVHLYAVRMAESVGVQPSKSRTSALQRDRSNIEADTAEEWYKLNIAIHIISDLAKTASSLLCLL